MGVFLKRDRGSVTVLVALILAPTVFFTSFLVDLARLKLYGNQALMTADNYGEAALSQYDNVLKELYGLFAMAQDEESTKALEQLQDYVRSSFDPSVSTVSWEHLQSVLGETSYEGFMPYRAAQVTLECEKIGGSTLSSNPVLSTQIGDFMKFRIAQQLADDGSELLDTISQIQNSENDSEAVKKKVEIDEEAKELLEKAEKYYRLLAEFTKYPEYISKINQTYLSCQVFFADITAWEKDKEATTYKIYYDYETCDADALTAALAKREALEAAEDAEAEADAEAGAGTDAGADSEDADAGSGDAGAGTEPLTPEEQALLDIYDAWEEDEDARREPLAGQFNQVIFSFTKVRMNQGAGGGKPFPVDFANYDEKLSELSRLAGEITGCGQKLKTLQGQLRTILNEGVSEDVRMTLQETLGELDLLFGDLETYTRIVAFIQGYSGTNHAYGQQAQAIEARMGEIRDAYLDCADAEGIPEWEDRLDESAWRDFRADHDAKEQLYLSLESCFGSDGDESEAKKKQEEAENVLKDAQEEINKEETDTLRNVPTVAGYHDSGNIILFDLGKMVKSAASYFSMNSFSEAASKLLLKVYTVEYDFGMFTNRMTGKKNAESGGEPELSLTGYEKCPNINYLYQAELEYLLGGHNSSMDNWKETRNRILAFRGIANYLATYQVEEINSLIRSIAQGAGLINPALGLVVDGALRLAVAGVETAADWQLLKDGDGVVLFKRELKQLAAYNKVKSLLPRLSGDKRADDSPTMDYEQHLLVMLVFLTTADELAERTRNLIELNINAVREKVGSEGTLKEISFKMGNAYTAVTASCTVHLDFAVIPSGFARLVASPESYAGLEQVQRNSYRFAVTRGY